MDKDDVVSVISSIPTDLGNVEDFDERLQFTTSRPLIQKQETLSSAELFKNHLQQYASYYQHSTEYAVVGGKKIVNAAEVFYGHAAKHFTPKDILGKNGKGGSALLQSKRRGFFKKLRNMSFFSLIQQSPRGWLLTLETIQGRIFTSYNIKIHEPPMTTVVGASSCKSIARDISTHLGVRYTDPTVERFSDQELRIQLPCSLYEEDAIVVQSTCNPANDHLMELLLLIDAVRRAGSRRVIAAIPYFGYSRQDRPSYEWGPISARLIATLLEAAGADHMVTLDLHSKQAEGFFKIGVQNIDPMMMFASTIQPCDNILVVSPDIGGLVRARKLADILHSDLAVIHKTRKTHNTCEMNTIIGDVSGKQCILVDDIVDTGATLCQAAILLKTHHAKSVHIMVTHAVLSHNAQDRLREAPIDTMVTTNSIPQLLDPARFQVLDVAPILSQAIQKLMHT